MYWQQLMENKNSEKTNPPKCVYSGRGEGVPVKPKGVRTISHLDEVKQMALNTQIDTKPSKTVGTLNFPSIEECDLEAQIENNCSIDEISPIDLKKPTTKPVKKNFVIKKTNPQREKSAKKASEKFKTPQIGAKKTIVREDTKSYVFPSSISAISSKVSEPKRYFFKDQNIFVSTKSKTELFDDMMENQTKKSILTASTAATSKKSMGTDTNWYMSDKTKKCMRALQETSHEPENSYVANLDKNDPGRKKVRFMEDLKGAKTGREIGYYTGFADKRDLKSFKREMLENNWAEKITGLKN